MSATLTFHLSDGTGIDAYYRNEIEALDDRDKVTYSRVTQWVKVDRRLINMDHVIWIELRS